MSKGIKLLRGGVVTAIVLASGGLGGCSLFQPYEWSDDFNPSIEDSRDLDKAVAFAQRMEEQYTQAANTQQDLATLGGPMLFPLAAGATALGAAEIGGGAITQLSIAGSTVFATASWLRSPTREQAFVMGANSIDCLLKAASPITTFEPAMRTEARRMIGLEVIPSSDISTVNLQAAIARARSAHDNMEASLRRIDALDDGSASAETATKLRALRDNYLPDAAGVIESGTTSLDSAYTFNGKFRQTAANIVNGVKTVEGAVKLIVRTTIPNLSTAPDLIKQLQSSITPNVPPVAVAPAAAGGNPARGLSGPGSSDTPEVVAELDNLRVQKEILDRAMADISFATVRIAAIVGQLRSDALSNTLPTECVIDATHITGQLSASPNPVTVDAAVGGDQTVNLDGRFPFTITPYGANAPAGLIAVISAPPAGSGYTVAVKAVKHVDNDATTLTAPAADTEYDWQIRDGTGNSIILRVTLKAKKP